MRRRSKRSAAIFVPVSAACRAIASGSPSPTGTPMAGVARGTGFDLAAHVSRVRLPEPGGEEELVEWASEFYSQRLDRTRPLWEVCLVEA